jgi:hypothetical protein
MDIDTAARKTIAGPRCAHHQQGTVERGLRFHASPALQDAAALIAGLVFAGE